MARIGIFGAGYVGLVTGACFAELGHAVVVRDVVPEKVERLRAGEVPIYEPGLDELLERNGERLSFTTDVAEAIAGAEFLYVAVGTPRTHSGDADLSAVWTVVDELSQVGGDPVVVMKSTVPVGTGDKVRAALDARGLAHVGYVSNPEFLAEGTALHDFMHPDRIVIGAAETEDGDRVEALHAGLEAPVVRCDVASAEMVKLAANAFLSTRISFINEIANVCELVGADVESVAKGIGLDHRLGPHFLRAGIGFGGSCLVGEETVLVRDARATRLLALKELFEEHAHEEGATFARPDDLEVLAWREGTESAEWFPVAALTRRAYDGEVVDIRTKMGRRITATADHPFVVRGAPVKTASELTREDWLPLAQGAPSARRPFPGMLESVGVRTLAAQIHHERGYARAHDIVRSGALRLHEVRGAGISLEGAMVGAASNGTYVPTSLELDEDFWRICGLYIAISSRLLAGWWLECLGLGANCCTQRLPDRIWDAPESHKRALLAGVWRGDGSWSYVAGGPSVVLEYGTVSRELADGILRLLGDLGIAASQRVGRTRKSTCDTYWLRIAGADQVERMLEVVPEKDREVICASIARQAKRIAPTGYRRDGNTAWVRVVETVKRPFRGFVYSLEVPGAHTFVTTGGLVVHNCFPKDVSALKQLAGNSGYHFQLLSAVIEVNELQKRRVIAKLQKHLGPLRGKRIALLGLAFKPNTDDMREAPSLVIAGRLVAEGADVVGWDPVADGSQIPGVRVAESVLDAVKDADAAVVVTEWPQLREQLPTEEVLAAMAVPLIVDGRNLLDPAAVRAAGFAYEGIGRNGGAFETLPEIPEPA